MSFSFSGEGDADGEGEAGSEADGEVGLLEVVLEVFFLGEKKEGIGGRWGEARDHNGRELCHSRCRLPGCLAGKDWCDDELMQGLLCFCCFASCQDFELGVNFLEARDKAEGCELSFRLRERCE